MSTRDLCALALAGGVALATPSPAAADHYEFRARASATSWSAEGGTSSELDEEIVGSSTTNHGDSASAAALANGAGASSAEAFASFGLMQAEAFSQQDVPAPVTIGAQAEGGFTDLVQLTSMDGSPVTVRWSMPVVGTFSSTGSAYASARFEFDGGGQNADAIVWHNGSYLGGGPGYVDSIYLSGQFYTIAAEFDVQAGMNGLGATGQAGASFGQSAHLAAEVLTPGATLFTASGHDYAPVPEPAGALLAAAGGGVLAALSARRGRRRPA